MVDAVISSENNSLRYILLFWPEKMHTISLKSEELTGLAGNNVSLATIIVTTFPASFRTDTAKW